MKLFGLLTSIVMSAVFIHAEKSLGTNAGISVPSEAQTKNTITEFLQYANSTERAIMNIMHRYKMTLFDFTTMENVNNWKELSDTVRKVGKSKAVFVLQKTQEFQRALFFTLLNPQSNGAGFAGVRTSTNLNLTGFKSIEIICRGQGKNSHYKIVLEHEDIDPYDNPSYEQFFTAPMPSEEFSTVNLPFTNFKPYYRGREIPDAEPLNIANITAFGLQIYGGVYTPIKQSGVSALEVETISAVA